MVSLIDLFVAITLAWGITSGWKKGFLIQFVSFGVMLIGIFLANLLALASAKSFPRFNLNPHVFMMALFIVFTLVAGYMSYIIEKIVEKMTEQIKVSSTVRIVGVGIGGAKMFLLDSVFVYLLNGFNSSREILPHSMFDNSFFNEPMVKLAPIVFRFLQNYDFQPIV